MEDSRTSRLSNCVFDGCNGLAIESVDGAVIEDVTCTNITMRDVVGAPIFIRLGARMRGPAGVPVGKIRRVILSNITCHATRRSTRIGSILAGIPGHPIEDVKISDVMIAARGRRDDRAMLRRQSAGEREGLSGAEHVWRDSGARIFHPACEWVWR